MPTDPIAEAREWADRQRRIFGVGSPQWWAARHIDALFAELAECRAERDRLAAELAECRVDRDRLATELAAARAADPLAGVVG